MEIHYNIINDYVHGVDIHLAPLEFLLLHAVLRDALDNSTNADDVVMLGGMIDDIEEQLEKQVVGKGDENENERRSKNNLQ